MHDAQEKFNKTGVSPPEESRVGTLFRAALPYIPLPGRGKSEGRREITIAGHKYTVLLDWYGSSEHLPEAPPGLPAVLDFKTSKDPKAYGVGFAKPPLTDPQVVLYSAFALVGSGAQEVYGRWLYLHTVNKSKIAFPFDFQYSKGEVEDAFGEVIYPASNLLKKLKKERPDPNSVAPNPLACNDYNKLCWYAAENGGRCRLTDQDRKDALSKALFEGDEDDMGLRDIAAKAQKAAPAAPTPVEEKAEINPPDKIEDVPEPAPKTKKAPTKKAATKAEDPATIIGRGVLAIIDALKS